MRKKSPHQTKEWVVYLTDTPVGPLKLSFSERGLAALEFAGEESAPPLQPDSPPAHLQPLIEKAKQELTAYFNGAPADFDSITLDPQGTPFQLRVWQELRRIPRGKTISYGELARRVGNPKACRAVGQANGHNPLPLIVPCHRVIAADGSLGGFSSGLDHKRWLLRHEGAM
ncbi:MAG: methylated-DNA--[protein]-cysteine S-methyltransferase [Syntrophobacterales bacterium]|jgi:methylated-DNA-[protein]-cysteine S-methyltransferase|nr:methylated-DNA--[protein]-cysteine S-methyltransferase [Syntrophobacterales bacterium]